jgi:hypothetical protein
MAAEPRGVAGNEKKRLAPRGRRRPIDGSPRGFLKGLHHLENLRYKQGSRGGDAGHAVTLGDFKNHFNRCFQRTTDTPKCASGACCEDRRIFDYIILHYGFFAQNG